MEQLLAHLVGDYVLQNHWMANTKTKSWVAAAVHAGFYSLPFLLLVSNVWQWAVIAGTHLIIDRFRLAKYWVDFWGVGNSGRLFDRFYKKTRVKIDHSSPSDLVGLTMTSDTVVGTVTAVNDDGSVMVSTAPPSAPPFLGVWLLILVDNTMHLCINYGALKWL